MLGRSGKFLRVFMICELDGDQNFLRREFSCLCNQDSKWEINDVLRKLDMPPLSACAWFCVVLCKSEASGGVMALASLFDLLVHLARDSIHSIMALGGMHYMAFTWQLTLDSRDIGMEDFRARMFLRMFVTCWIREEKMPESKMQCELAHLGVEMDRRAKWNPTKPSWYVHHGLIFHDEFQSISGIL